MKSQSPSDLNVILLPDCAGEESLGQIVEKRLHTYFLAHEGCGLASGLYDRIIQEIEKPLLRLALKECRGNQLKTAALLGLNRNTLRKKIRQLGLSSEGRGGRAHSKSLTKPQRILSAKQSARPIPHAVSANISANKAAQQNADIALASKTECEPAGQRT